jgi:hypothetical protein
MSDTITFPDGRRETVIYNSCANGMSATYPLSSSRCYATARADCDSVLREKWPSEFTVFRLSARAASSGGQDAGMSWSEPRTQADPLI